MALGSGIDAEDNAVSQPRLRGNQGVVSLMAVMVILNLDPVSSPSAMSQSPRASMGFSNVVVMMKGPLRIHMVGDLCRKAVNIGVRI
jgi:hypothetical protein